MKFKAVFFLSLYALLLLASADSNAQEQTAKKTERWFEIEVILFKQLGDKKLIKEQFPDYISSQSDVNEPSQHDTFFDLLTPYLQPDLSALKYSLPKCNQETISKEVIFKDTISKATMLKETIYQSLVIEQPSMNFDSQQAVLNSSLYATDNLCVFNQAYFEKILSPEQLANFNIDGFGVSALPSKLNASGSHNSTSPYIIADDSLLLKNINQKLRWSKEFKPLLHFGWRQVGITKKKAIPLKLFAGEHLDYVYQQANDNYQAELVAAELAAAELAAAELAAAAKTVDRALFESLTAATEQGTTTELSTTINENNLQAQKQAELDDYAQIKQQKLAQLFTDIDKVTSDSNSTIIAELEQQTLTSLLADRSINERKNTPLLDLRNPPTKPLQSWFLDGFFKVHLDHYLYITADFNLFNDSKLAQENIVDDNKIASDKSNKLKLINFSQNRRVITGEIHYFDHPYIGMIVQIRRFDPTKPADEAVTQAKNN